MVLLIRSTLTHCALRLHQIDLMHSVAYLLRLDHHRLRLVDRVVKRQARVGAGNRQIGILLAHCHHAVLFLR